MQQNKKVFIIAEAGVNHNGKFDIAKKMVDVAYDAGADAIKFQTFKTENLVTRKAPKAKYQTKNTNARESQFEMLKRLELSESDYKQLMVYCRRKNIIFMSSPFDEESIDFLDKLGMDIFKIPSSEITNKPLIQRIASKKKPIILSTGMSYMKEIGKAIAWINETWRTLYKKPQLALLHCVSNYPAQKKDVNLMAMKTLKLTFSLPVGYSDHTLGIEIPIAAAAIGADIIEKHFTLDKKMKGPDNRASLNPEELKEMIKALRNVEEAMGDGVKKPARHEEDIKNKARRSLVAARDLKKGNIVTLKDIAIKRPGTGLAPELVDEIIDRRLIKNVKKDMFFKEDHFVDSYKS